MVALLRKTPRGTLEIIHRDESIAFSFLIVIHLLYFKIVLHSTHPMHNQLTIKWAVIFSFLSSILLNMTNNFTYYNAIMMIRCTITQIVAYTIIRLFNIWNWHTPSGLLIEIGKWNVIVHTIYCHIGSNFFLPELKLVKFCRVILV